MNTSELTHTNPADLIGPDCDYGSAKCDSASGNMCVQCYIDHKNLIAGFAHKLHCAFEVSTGSYCVGKVYVGEKYCTKHADLIASVN